METKWVSFLLNKNILETPDLTTSPEFPREALLDFDSSSYDSIKKIEKSTNHDIKAVEYYLKDKLNTLEAPAYSEFIHFLCTSEDINNLAYSLMISNFVKETFIPKIQEFIHLLAKLAIENENSVMMARTHGQPASPTTLGKEMANFVYRINRQYKNISDTKLTGKINGAVGNYNCHRFVLEDVDWREVTKEFVEGELGLNHNAYT